ncbi:MAG TPA: hypothetical protein VIU29_03280 [Candidatus Deferrimicrobiaceae bacterium]
MTRFWQCIRPLALAVLLATIATSGLAGTGDIAIIVDGLPLDARAIAIKDEVYVPAWILENYAHTKVNWSRQSNLLEILTTPSNTSSAPADGTLKLKVGFYLDAEGFVIGQNTRLYMLNVDPKDFRTEDGKTAAERAHEGSIERIGSVSEAMKNYLRLPPLDRFTARGWSIVSKMPKEEIATLSSSVEKYETLYKSLYYDLITNMVISKQAALTGSSVVEGSLKGVRIDIVPVSDDGTAQLTLPNGLYYLYARMLYRNRQIVWDMPISLRGGESVVELSNRNAALMN